MSTYTITGGKPLYGSVRVGGAKNASYKLMIAALLGNSPSRLLNFSHISDVKLVAHVINELGAKAQQVGERAYMVDPQNLHQMAVSGEYGEASRASTFFLPILLHRFGHASVPLPGGDKIGVRSLDWHFAGLEKLGVSVSVVNNAIEARAEKFRGTRYRFPKNSHTGTETMLMTAVLAEGTTILENAAEETEVDDLINFLNLMGGKIRRSGPRTIEIVGVPELQGAIYKIMPDQNQVVSFACAAIATKGDVIVENARRRDLEAFLTKLDEINAGYEIGQYGIRFYYKGPLTSTDVTTEIHPGFKTDWQPLWVALMTQAQGTSILHEKIYQSRFGYVTALNEMGADIELFNPPIAEPQNFYNFDWKTRKESDTHAARITGPSALHGGEFQVKDLRHGATLMIAGLVATGQTILHDPEQQIDRGYEMLDAQFQRMGAIIERQET